MNKIKLTQIGIAVLILANCIIMAMFVFNSRGQQITYVDQKISEHQKHLMVRDLFAFDESQFKRFLNSKKAHGDSILLLSKTQRELSRELYLDRNDDLGKAKQKDLMDELNAINHRIYMANIRHLKDIENICREDQKQYIDSFINDILNPRSNFPGNN